MVNHTATDRPVRRSRAFRAAAAAVSALVVLTTVELSADRRSSGGSVRQSDNTSRNTGANRDNNYDRNTNANRDTNANRNTNVNNNVNRNTNVNNNVNVNRNTNVNVNRNVNANAGYYNRPGGVAVGEEGAVAVGRRGAVAATDEGFVGVGRHGAVVGGERYESYEGWKVAAGVATGIAVGTMLARPPAASVTVVTSGTNYMYNDGAVLRTGLLRRSGVVSRRPGAGRRDHRDSARRMYHDRDGRRLGAAVRKHLLQARQQRLPGRGVLNAPQRVTRDDGNPLPSSRPPTALPTVTKI